MSPLPLFLVPIVLHRSNERPRYRTIFNDFFGKKVALTFHYDDKIVKGIGHFLDRYQNIPIVRIEITKLLGKSRADKIFKEANTLKDLKNIRGEIFDSQRLRKGI